MQIDLTMRNFGKETLNLLGCVSGMKDEFDPINYPRYDFNYQERLKTFRGIQVRNITVSLSIGITMLGFRKKPLR